MYDAVIAERRFECARSFVDVMFEPSNPYRATSFIVKAFQKVIDCCVEHPNFLDVHIAAYNGFVDFFQKSKLTAEQINAQTAPDFYAPLHLAIKQGFGLTLKAILAFRPDTTLVDCAGNTILHFAVMSNSDVLDTVLRIRNIRSLFTRNRNHWNPIELVCYHSKIENLQRLIAFGLPARMLSLIGEPGRALIDDRTEQTPACIDNDRTVEIPKSLFTELDFTVVNCGGSPLHWARTPNAIERLLKQGFDIDSTNWRGETALATMIRCNLSKCAITLLCNDANPNLAVNSANNLPLIIAIKQRSTSAASLARILLVFDADVDAKDAAGRSARHLAATNDRIEILHMLISLGANRCRRKSTSIASETLCVKGCFDDSIIGDHRDDSATFPITINRNSRNSMNDCEQDANNARKKVNMVCFDGGGIRGLFAVQLMIELSRFMRVEFRDRFEWISGTSTGGIIALLLAQGRSLFQIRKLYFRFKDRIIVGPRPYNTDNIERLFRHEIGADLRMRDFDTMHRKKVVLFATRVDVNPPKLQIFRSYAYPDEEEKEEEEEESHREDDKSKDRSSSKSNSDSNSNSDSSSKSKSNWNSESNSDSSSKSKSNSKSKSKSKPKSSEFSCTTIKAWKALRASAAAPTFFRAYPPFIDGGFLANNPTVDTLTEYFRYQRAISQRNNNKNCQNSPHECDDQLSSLRLVLSFGTGQLRPATAAAHNLSEVFDKFHYFLNLSNLIGFDLNRAIRIMKELFAQIRSLVTNCNEQVVFRADTWCNAPMRRGRQCRDQHINDNNNISYFRLNPVMQKKIPLDETNDAELMKALMDVKVYAFRRSAELKKLARLIDNL